MKTLNVLFLALTVSLSAFAHNDPPADTITIAKSTELAVHRIERLVTLKKIDPAFQTNLIGLQAESSTENGATYKVYGYIAPGSNGKSTSITLWMDNQGKTLAYNVNQDQMPANPFSWPVKDSVTLMEEGLHFVLEGWAQHPEVKPFFNGLKTISMTPAQDAQGNLVAKFRVTNDDDAKVLSIVLKPDGTFISYEIN